MLGMDGGGFGSDHRITSINHKFPQDLPFSNAHHPNPQLYQKQQSFKDHQHSPWAPPQMRCHEHYPFFFFVVAELPALQPSQP